MTEVSSGRQIAFHTAIRQFIKERLDAKLDKLADDDPKRTTLTEQHQLQTWLEDAARRAGQIQLVTHSLKPIHPDARGSNLYCPPGSRPAFAEIGTHVLGNNAVADVVGNAAALDVYKLLKREVEGKTLLEWMQAQDADLLAALSPDLGQARSWMEAFTGVSRPRDDPSSSHANARQLYWLSGDDPLDDDHFVLLAPLYATSLAHAVYETLNHDRFSEATKAARQARRDKAEHDTGYRDYPELAVQKLGGTKPQNISQLNSERGGNNYLLSSLPPHWKSRDFSPPWRIESIFSRFESRLDAKLEVRLLLEFLKTDPPTNVATRNKVDRHVDALIDELVLCAREIQSNLPEGWSSDSRCRLPDDECLWLDPGRCVTDEAFLRRWLWMDWPEKIGTRFGNWLNHQLGNALPVGEVEAKRWRDELLIDESLFGWAWSLDEKRKQIQPSINIPVGEATP